jgi:hypothetical protein
MDIKGLIFLIFAHYITGRGTLKLFRIQDTPLRMFCLSIMIGVPILSFVPCVLQLMHMPINKANTAGGIAILAGLAIIPLLIKMKRPRLPRFTLPAIYEIPFIFIFLLNLLLSVWRCYYYPVTARDMLTGPEVLAEFTVKEGTMLNSVFSVDLHTSNNYFKSPYLTCLQIIYKLLVHPFGQLWLSVFSIAFMVWIYSIVREKLHPLIAASVFFVFLIEPEFFAYTYLILYDFSNMVFFFCGFYFLAKYFEKKANGDFAFSVFCFGLATYIRTETLILIGLSAPMLALYFYRQKASFISAAMRIGSLMLVPALFYVLCMQVFVRNFVPVPFDVTGQVTANFFDLSPIFDRLKTMADVLIFSQNGPNLYGYMLYLFCIVLAIDAIFMRRFSREARIALYGVAVVYVGMAVVGYLLPLADLANTSKRGLFKLLPLALLYLANSAALLKLSERIRNWELGIKPAVKAAAQKIVKPAAKQPVTTAAQRPQMARTKR